VSAGASPEALSAPPRGRALCLSPHPDDDVIGCGGTLALHRAQGDAVRVVVAFDGALGLAPGVDPSVRCAEALRAGQRLGVSDYVFLGHPEGHEPRTADLERGATELRGQVAAWAPEVVYVPWMGEQHLDHRTLARVARLALAGFQGQVWGYEVWTPLVPARVVDVTSVWGRKLASLREHTSQLERSGLEARMRGMGALRGVHLPAGGRYGEAFEPFRPGEQEVAA
jgi:LmbE family N-acetylglucosaminyl deacetylase